MADDINQKKAESWKKRRKKKLSYNNIRLYFVLYRGKIKKKITLKKFRRKNPCERREKRDEEEKTL